MFKMQEVDSMKPLFVCPCTPKARTAFGKCCTCGKQHIPRFRSVFDRDHRTGFWCTKCRKKYETGHQARMCCKWEKDLDFIKIKKEHL